MRCSILYCACVLLMGAAVSSAGEGLAPEVLSRVKDVTVFVKVDAGRSAVRGSGFLIKADGETGYVVTNNHVIDTTPPPGRDVPRPSPGGKPVITLVFRSGSPSEQSVRAEVVAADPERDLAVLKVVGVKNLPAPLDLSRPATPTETTPVYVLGFPFGEALSGNKRNPALTVGRGSVSSLRFDDKGQIAAVQIDGALNPGNSGGPVVDTDGRLAGVAVAAIRGADIGLAIPMAELTRMLLGRVGGFDLRVVKGQKGIFTVHVTMRLIDPMNKIRSVVFHYIESGAAQAAAVKGAKEGVGGLEGGHQVELKIEGQQATGTFEIAVPEKGERPISFQAVARNDAASPQVTPLRDYRIKDSPPAAVAAATAPAAKPDLGADLDAKKIPDSAAVGSIHGSAFRPDHFTLHGGILDIREGENYDADLRVIFLLKKGESLVGKTTRLTPGAPYNAHVHLHFKPQGSNTTFSGGWASNYTLILEIGDVEEGHVRGKIYLALPEDPTSFVAGTFNAEVR